MYKKQMTLQRVVCYLLLAAAVLVFVYSLGIMTDMYENNFAYLAEDPDSPLVEGTEIYYNMQEFNQSLTGVGIALILLAISQFVTQTHSRRKYYIANYITVGVTAVANVAASVWALIKVFSYRADYLLIDFEGVAFWADILGKEYTESTFWFDISIFVFAFLIIVTGLSVFNLYFKNKVMKEEQALIAAGKEKV